MSRRPPSYRDVYPLETAAAGQLPAQGTSAWEASHQRLRIFLIVTLVGAMPISIVLGEDRSATNMAASDALMPLGILFLGGLLMSGRLRLPMITFCLLSLSCTVASIFYNLDAYFQNGQPVRMAIEVGKVASLWLLFYLFINLLQTRSDLRLLVKVWVLGAVFEALCGIGASLAYQLYGIETPFSEMFRAQGTLGDSNLFAAHLAAGVLLTLLYRRLSSPVATWTIFAIFAQVGGIYFSASRGGLLSFGIGLVVLWLMVASKRQKLVNAAVGLGVVISILWMINQNGRFTTNLVTERLKTSTLSLDDPEALQRVTLWRAALQGFYDSPLLGVGSGNFAYLRATGSQPGGRAHNTYLEILCENGVLGFLVYLTFVIAVLSGLYGRGRSHLDLQRRAVNGILFAAVLLVGLNGVTISIQNYRGLWILLALVAAYERLYLTRPLRSLARASVVSVEQPAG
jgi:O-antigen ligase